MRYWCSEGCGFVEPNHRCEQWSRLTHISTEAETAIRAEVVLAAGQLNEENQRLQARIAELEASQQWVPVGEPPEEYEPVWVYGPGLGQRRAVSTGGGRFEVMGAGTYDVTHWMPLPPPPKEPTE